MKGLILSGGSGTRLRPLTHTRAKQLLPIVGSPILHHILNSLQDAGIKETVILISPETGDLVRESCGSSWKNMKLEYVIQDKPLGLAHAVSTAQHLLGDEPFLLFLGDNVLKGGVKKYVDQFESKKMESMVLLAKVEKPQQFGVAIFKNDKLVGMVEKPEIPPSDLALVGIYFFNKKIHKIIENLKPSKRGEYEITDAIQGLINDSVKVQHMRVDGWWKDTGLPKDLIEANKLLLEDIETRIDGKMSGGRLAGKVIVEKNAIVENSYIEGPVYIGEGSVVRNSNISAGTSVGKNCHLNTVDIGNSIIMDKCTLSAVSYPMSHCLIGEGCTVKGNVDSRLNLVLGDRSILEVPD